MAPTLNALMEFDHVVRVHPDGTITEPRDVRAPEVQVQVDADGQILPGKDGEPMIDPDGWSLMTGYSRQDRYPGPIMHPSEYVGGGMERDIRENAGLYVAVLVTCLPTTDADDDGEPAGWAVAYRHDA